MAIKGMLLAIRENIEASLKELDDINPALLPHFFQAKKMLEYAIKNENSRELEEAVVKDAKERRDMQVLYILLGHDNYMAIARRTGIPNFEYKYAGHSFSEAEVTRILEEITQHEYEMVEDY